MTMQFLKTATGAEPVIAEAIFPAAPARVFKAWTEPDEIMQWFGPKAGELASAEIDLRVGGRWCFVVADGEAGRSSLQGTYTEIVPDARLQFTWQHVSEGVDGTREETPISTVTVTFAAHGAATQVHLRHEGIVKEDGRKGVGKGWEATFGHLHAVLAQS